MKVRKRKLRESYRPETYLDLAQACANALVTYGTAFGDYAYFNADAMLRDLERLQSMDEEDIEYIDSDKTRTIALLESSNTPPTINATITPICSNNRVIHVYRSASK